MCKQSDAHVKYRLLVSGWVSISLHMKDKISHLIFMSLDCLVFIITRLALIYCYKI